MPKKIILIAVTLAMTMFLDGCARSDQQPLLEKNDVDVEKEIAETLERDIFLSEQMDIVAITQEKAPQWIEAWNKINSEFDITVFEKKEEIPLGSTSIYEQEYNANNYNSLREIFYVYSPDGEKFLDPHYYTELYEENGTINAGLQPDSAVALIDLSTNTWSQMIFCGTACRLNDAFWMDDTTFVVIGDSEYYPENGEQRCTAGEKCTYVPLLYVFDLEKDTKTLYQGPETEKKPELYMKTKFPQINFK